MTTELLPTPLEKLYFPGTRVGTWQVAKKWHPQPGIWEGWDINTAFIKKICQKICQPPLPSLPLIKTFELGLKEDICFVEKREDIPSRQLTYFLRAELHNALSHTR